jgi:replicative DNA helicase
MDELLSRQLPHSVEAEQSVLGAMLIDPGCIPEVVETLRPEDFYLTQNRHIFETIYSMFILNQTIDPVTVLDQLSVRGVAEAAGGRQYFLQLMDITPTAANVSIYVQIVRDKAVLRTLGEVVGEISDLVLSGEGEAADVIELAEQKIYSIRNERENKGLSSISSVLMDVYEHLGELAKNKGKLPGVPTGFSDLDTFLTGLNNSDLILLAARPGMGKTSVALNIAVNAARATEKAVVVFSLEMSKEQLAMRLISSEALIDSRKLKTGLLSEDEWIAVAHASGILSKTNIYLDDTASISVGEMKAKCRRLSGELGLIIIDYLQLMQTGRRFDNRVQEVSEISRSLKIMAKELNVPVLCLSQLSRAPEQRTGKDKRPRLSDLRESGAIEQDADVVIFLYRDDYYNKEESPEPGVIEFLIEKNRHGGTDTIKLHWDGKYTKVTCFDHART